ncbi:MAG: PAS domain S-box protein [Prolixibacteraceae bacterium]|nr:PAS domain S-box protein [Prolixibacteraceae bacterium]
MERFFNKKGHTKREIERLKRRIATLEERQLKQQEQEKILREKLLRLDKIMLATNDGTWDWNLKTDEIHFGPRYYEMAGYIPDEFPHRLEEFQKRIHPDDTEHVMAQIRKYLNDESKRFEKSEAAFVPGSDVQKRLNNRSKRFVIEFRFKRKNGDWMWVMGRGVIVERDENNVPMRFVGTHTDITQRKEIERALQENEEKLRLMIDNSPVGFSATDLNGIFMDVNPVMCRILGYSRKELIGKHFNDFSHPDDIEKNRTEFERLVSGEVSHFDLKKRYIHKSGKIVDAFLRSQLVRDNNRKPIFQIAIVQDITERKRAEQIRKVLFNISNAVATTDNLKTLINQIQIELGTIIDTTNFYIALYDKEKETLSLPFFADEKDEFTVIPAGKTLTYFVIKTQKPLLANNARMKELEEAGEIELLGSDAEVWLGVPLKIEGKVTGVLAVQSYTGEDAFTDSDRKMLEFVSDQISLSIHRKKTEEDLLKALEKAKESDRLKIAFLQNMSHEIRTPMNGILGFTSLLKEPELNSEELLEYVKIIEESGARMLNTLNDLMDISKIEAGQMEVKLAEVNINEQFEYLQAFFENEAVQKGLKLTKHETLPWEEATIETDAEKVYAILANLIKNALKYTQKGTIDFGYALKDNIVVFYVRDTGIGIPKEKLESVFERFVQVDQNLSSYYEGVGLGLSIAKAYAKMLGGKIWVKSEKNKGSTFYFTIPKNKKTENIILSESEDPEGLNINLRNLKILISEDDEMACMFLTLILKDFTREILYAHNGIETVELCRNNSDIDIILMDIKMPKMNGYEATKKIREFNKEVIIIAQTAFALSGDQEKSLDAGCDDYVSKPISKEILIGKIKKQFNRKATP